MSDDSSKLLLRGTGGAIRHNIQFHDVYHPWHLPYFNTCIIKNCKTKPSYDGSTYFTCCLSCLRDKELGPFYKNKKPRLYNALYGSEQSKAAPTSGSTYVLPE